MNVVVGVTWRRQERVILTPNIDALLPTEVNCPLQQQQVVRDHHNNTVHRLTDICQRGWRRWWGSAWCTQLTKTSRPRQEEMPGDDGRLLLTHRHTEYNDDDNDDDIKRRRRWWRSPGSRPDTERGDNIDINISMGDNVRHLHDLRQCQHTCCMCNH